MRWQPTPYSLPLAAFAVGAALLAVLTLRRRPAPGASPLAVLMVAVSVWCFGYWLELAGVAYDTKIFWARFKYFGIVTVPATWIVFVLEYTGHIQRLTWRLLALLMIQPVAVLALLWTNEQHELYWTDPYVQPVGSYTRLASGFGPLFWVASSYAYGVYLVGLVLLLRRVLRSARLFRSQQVLLTIGALAPWVGNILFLADVPPFDVLDATPFAFGISGAALIGALFGFRLLDVVPVARDRVIEHMSDLVIVLDAADRVIDLNPAARTAFDLTAQAVGQPAAMVFHAHPALTARLGPPVSVQGEEFPLNDRCYDLSVSLLHDARTRTIGRLIVLRDITERKRAEEQVRAYTAELEATNRELDAFSHTVAHDLKSPLSLISGYISLLRHDQPEARITDVTDILDTIDHATLKMGSMIQSLLKFARLRDAAKTLVPIDTSPIAHAAAARFEHTITARGIALIIDPAMPRALGYGPWIEEVFANLIDNAIKYIGSKNPAPRIEVRGLPQPDDDRVRFEVRDNGIGIAPQNVARLFDMFSRFDTAEASGFGLGLSIVARIVQKQSGTLGVESEQGQGSTFWFTLRAAPPGPRSIASDTSPPVAAAPPPIAPPG